MGRSSATGLSLPVSGTVAQVQSAFSTPISKYRLSSGKTGYDNATAPEVPVSVAPQIEGILGLDTLSPPQPSANVPEAGRPRPIPMPTRRRRRWRRAARAEGSSCSSAITSVEGRTGALDAPDLAQAYAFDPLYSSSHYGAGSTVALVEMAGAGYSTSDIGHFADCYDVTPGNGQITQVSVGRRRRHRTRHGRGRTRHRTVLSLAPKADIEVYEGGTSDSLYDVFSRIVNDDTAKIVSASWTNGCEAYVGQALQNSENTLFQAAAAEGQSTSSLLATRVRKGATSTPRSMPPRAPIRWRRRSTLQRGPFISPTNRATLSVSTAREPRAAQPTSLPLARCRPARVPTPSRSMRRTPRCSCRPDSTLTVFSTTSCNQSTTSGCSSPTQIASGGDLSSPAALAVSGSTLYVGNGNGTVAVYNASTNAYVTTVILPTQSVPTALAVDSTNGIVYIADGPNNRVEYFSATTCNATTTSGCSTMPSTVPVGHDPIALTLAGSAGTSTWRMPVAGGGIRSSA